MGEVITEIVEKAKQARARERDQSLSCGEPTYAVWCGDVPLCGHCGRRVTTNEVAEWVHA